MFLHMWSSTGKGLCLQLAFKCDNKVCQTYLIVFLYKILRDNLSDLWWRSELVIN